MMTSDDKVGGWVKKGQNHDDVILECPLSQIKPIKKLLTSELTILQVYRPFLYLPGNYLIKKYSTKTKTKKHKTN